MYKILSFGSIIQNTAGLEKQIETIHKILPITEYESRWMA